MNNFKTNICKTICKTRTRAMGAAVGGLVVNVLTQKAWSMARSQTASMYFMWGEAEAVFKNSCNVIAAAAKVDKTEDVAIYISVRSFFLISVVIQFDGDVYVDLVLDEGRWIILESTIFSLILNTLRLLKVCFMFAKFGEP